MATLNLSGYGVKGLVGELVEPWLEISVNGGEVVKSTPQAFAADLDWGDALVLELTPGGGPPYAVEVKVWDKDVEEPVAAGATELTGEAGDNCTMQLTGGESGEETSAWVSWKLVKSEPYSGFGWVGNPSKFQRLLKEKDQFLEEYFQLAIQQAESFDTELGACCMIQRLWRGTLARLRMFERSFATLNIQRIWRGFSGRLEYAQRLIVAQRKGRLAYYDFKATYMQKVMRGFRSRKHKHDYYARKKFLNTVNSKNETLRAELEQHYEQQMEDTMARELEAARSDFARLISDKHHLVSTVTTPGIFNSPFPGMQPTAFGEYVDDHLRRTVEGLGTRTLPKIGSGPLSRAPGPQQGGSLQASSPYDAVDQAGRSTRRVSNAVRANVSPYEFRPTRAQYDAPHPPSVHLGPQTVDASKVLERSKPPVEVTWKPGGNDLF